ncbi:MAG: hypothetical protein JRE40_12680 [Deltaproteobacteria bacterium]|nr:hypothetical protein [Deltaproteobacteria bacterium]
MIVAGYGPFGYCFAVLGVGIAIDDAIEHTITADAPFRVLFEKILWPLVIKFNDILKRRSYK